MLQNHDAGSGLQPAASNSPPSHQSPQVGKLIAGALLKAQRSIRGIHKSGRNKFHGYDYTTAEDMIAACRRALHANDLTAERVGCTIVAVASDCVVAVKGAPDLIGKQTVWMLRSAMLLCHAPSGEARSGSFDYPICPERGRPLDKAASASMSTSLSYYLRDLLQVPRCDLIDSPAFEVDRDDVSADRNQAPAPLLVALDYEQARPRLERLIEQMSHPSLNGRKGAAIMKEAGELDRAASHLKDELIGLWAEFDTVVESSRKRQSALRRARQANQGAK
jgi:hypothetical protein